MGWTVDEVGLGVALSRSLPSFVASRYRDLVRRPALARMDIEPVLASTASSRHPGGTKVLDALEKSALDVSRP